MKNSLAKTIRTAAAAMGAVMALSCAPAAFAEDAHDLSSLTAGEFTVMMGNGINLGNTMEAYGHVYGTDRDTSYYETVWGQPLTTAQIFADYKAAGFDSVRIPVAWTNMIDYESGDYTIDPRLLERVKEIVDYAYDQDMFVIINDHWDGSWWGMFGAKSASTRKIAEDLYVSMWTQIAEYFSGYDLHLVFEGANEELGDRLNDIPLAGCDISPELQAKLDAAGIRLESGVLTKDQCYVEANRINQLFVDTVRATGGNNAERFLLIPGYNTDFAATCDPRFHMPTDSAESRLLLSVHYYTPWSYCGTSGESSWGTVKNYEEMNELCKMMSRWTEAGYGVVIGECSAMPTSAGTLKPGTLDWFGNFFDNCDLYNFVPMVWETGDFHNKQTGAWIDDSLLSFMRERSNTARAGMTQEEIRAAAEAEMAAKKAAAPESFTYSDIPADAAVAWIMWDSADWNLMYSVGDTYDPDSRTAGLVPVDAQITGWGTYTVSLDFSGTAAGANTGTAFSAIGLRYGEVLFPGYVIDIVSITCDGKNIPMKGRPYTTSDDGLCTRVNLYNGWVSAIPADARTRGGGTIGCSPTVINSDTIGTFKKIEITFRFVPGAQGPSENDLRRDEKPSF